MRIVAGKYRGKILISPKHNIRPTLDKVKQAIFTRLQFEIEGKSVLDLFAGSGALGIEALSRGASRVVFCDKDDKSVKLVQDNLKSIGQNSKVVHADFKTYLTTTADKFDLILVDPPYASGYYAEVLEIIYQRKILNPEGIIVCERALKDEQAVGNFMLECTKKYGTVAVDYLKYNV